ncbi:MAG: hypothetical protein AB7L91_04380 [Dehalococcoidia bacterium]
MLPHLTLRRLGALTAVLTVLTLALLAIPASSPPAEAGSALPAIRIAGVGCNCGNEAANDIPLDLKGATVTRLDEDEFNALSPYQLRKMYDVIIITWDSDPDLNVDWHTRLRPYLKMGGGVIYEDPNNLEDLSAIIDARNDDDDDIDSSGLINVTRRVAGLVDGVADRQFDNNHIAFDRWARWLNPFLANDDVVGLFGQTEGGCIVLTGPDQDYHAERGSNDAHERNQYRLLLNEVRFVAGGCNGGFISR